MNRLFVQLVSRAFRAREEAQGVVEYALVLGVLVVALFVGFVTLDVKTAIGTSLTHITNALNGVANP